MTNTLDPTATKRLDYLDSLRALLMMQVLPMHVSMIYALGPEWFVSSADKSWFLTGLTTLFASFAMPGFFLIAGFLTVRVLPKKDPNEWFHQRTKRLAVPMITCVLVLSPIAIYAGTLSAQAGVQGAFDSRFGPDFSSNLAHIDERWIGHLWFLPTMWVYAFGVWCLARGGHLNAWVDRANNLITRAGHPFMVWAAIIGSVVVYRIIVTGGYFATEQALGVALPFDGIVNVRSWLLFLPYYVLGFMCARSSAIFENILRITPLRCGLIAIGFAIYVYVAPLIGFEAKVMKTIVKPLVGIGMIGIAIALARRYLNKKNAAARMIGESSYGIYLFHYPIIVLLGVYFYRFSLPPVLEFLLITLISLVASLMLTRFMLRVPLLAYLFNGVPLSASRQRNTQLAAR